MKILKKSLAIFLTLALCLSAMLGCLSVSAEGTDPALKINLVPAKDTYAPGETFDVAVYVENFADIKGAEFTVDFGTLTVDAESISSELVPLVPDNEEAEPNYWVNGSTIKFVDTFSEIVSGNLLVVSVTAPTTIPEEPIEVTVSNAKFGLNATELADVTVTGATVVVKETHVHEYTETDYDENGHWTECACGVKTEVAPHELGEAVENEGVWTKSCTCGYSVEVDAPVHNHSGAWVYDSENFNYKRVCDGCGITETKDLVISDEKTTISFTNKTFDLNSAISLMLYIEAAKVESYDGFFVEFVQPREGKDTKTLKVNKRDTVDEGYGNEHRFFYEGIAAREMGDTIYCTLYAVKDGIAYPNTTFEYSVLTYVNNNIVKTDAKFPVKYKRLVVDMLNYGAAAQVQQNYKVDRLVNADLTEQQKAYGTSTTPDAADNRVRNSTKDDPAYIAGSFLALENRVETYFYVEPVNYLNAGGDIEDLSLVVTFDGKTSVISVADAGMSGYGNTERQVCFADATSKDMRTLLTAQVYKNYGQADQEAVSGTYVYSVETYVARTRPSADAKLLDVINKMLAYGDSAANAFAK